MGDGARKIVSVSEIIGMEGEIITMQEIFRFVRTGVGAKGEVMGQFRPTGIRPRFSERLELYGYKLPTNVFEPGF